MYFITHFGEVFPRALFLLRFLCGNVFYRAYVHATLAILGNSAATIGFLLTFAFVVVVDRSYLHAGIFFSFSLSPPFPSRFWLSTKLLGPSSAKMVFILNCILSHILRESLLAFFKKLL